MSVTRREHFSAAHRLCDPTLTPEENERRYGRCVNPHGHNYVLEVTVSGAVDPRTGYVVDLRALSGVIDAQVLRFVDHRDLNVDVDWLRGLQPTAEVLAAAFFERIAAHLPGGTLTSVRLWETEKNIAECRGPV